MADNEVSSEMPSGGKLEGSHVAIMEEVQMYYLFISQVFLCFKDELKKVN